MTMMNDIPENIDRQLNETLGIDGDDEQIQEYTPSYRVLGDNKIPISKAEGKLWKNRKDQAATVMKDVTEQWDLTYKYYNADQIVMKDDGSFEFNNNKLRKGTKNAENLVWANNTGLIPALYSQDPTIEITSNKKNDEQSENNAVMLERLLNVLFKRRTKPGLNLKSKARKAILNTLLTNRGVIKIGWNFKNDATEEAINDINRIAEELEKAKDVKEIQKLEGQLQALEQIVNFSSQSGPYLKHVRPCDLFIDPNAQDQDGSDADWIMEREYLPTEFLKARFGMDTSKEVVESVYKPGKVLPVNTKGIDGNEEDALTLDDKDIDYSHYGYDNAESFKRSCLTECFWVWDKIKRRILLFSNNNWDYPIWVWEDLYNLEEFFPYYVLNFHENPIATLCKGETSYYLDQQDAINQINAQLQKMRNFGFDHYLFDTNSGVKIQDIQKWANGGKKIVGISLPPNKKFEEVLFAGQVPADKNQALYDKSDLLRVVDMISGTDATTRSGEYKTNTTNLAIQSYIAGKSMRIDDKRDLIENWIGNIGWGIAQLCLQFMDREQVAELIGENNCQTWQDALDPMLIKQNYSLTCVGGSTVKPTSDTKKQQALQISQILGQFAGASPYVSIIMLQVLERAFDEVVVTKEDISTIKMSIVQQLQAQQMMQQQQAELASAQANEAQTNADKNAIEAAQIMSAQNSIPAEQQVNTPNMLLGSN